MDYIAIRRGLHQIPELGFQEFDTQDFLLKQIEKMPQDHLEIKTWKTGILVKVSGFAPKRTIGFRADIDGLPVKEETGYAFKSRHEGHMHACGHDFHMTIALGVLAGLAGNPPADDVVIIFQPAEEGPGGAIPMMESDIFKAWKPDFIFSQHVSPEFPAGTAAIKEGILFANTSELFIDLTGKGGHAAYPHLTHDMVVAAASFVMQAQSIVARRVNPLDSAVLTIGKVTGGTKQNIIAEKARIEGTIRTLNQETMALIKEDVERLVKATEIAYHCKGEIDYGANYYQVYNRPEYARQFISFCKTKAFPYVICDDAMTGEDFGYFLKDIPGFMFWLGVGHTEGLHSSRFMPDERALAQGVRLVETFIREGSAY